MGKAKKSIKKIIIFFDGPISYFVIFPAYLLKSYRSIGSANLGKTTRMLTKIGVFPITNHYYEPLFDDNQLSRPLNADRVLPGVTLDLNEQITFIKKLEFASELETYEWNKKGKSELDFDINNGTFESGDAEFLYQTVRYLEPETIIEIGSGNSTKIIRKALEVNAKNGAVPCKHICIEPYENDWLKEFSDIELVKQKIEEFKFEWGNLRENDLVFIDSSHMIRPQGDVLKLYLEIIPILPKGVVVHIHDIFTPRDYLDSWIRRQKIFWNEQYLLEVLIQNTTRYRVLAALNHLKNHKYDFLKSVCPYLTPDREPGSFYIQIK